MRLIVHSLPASVLARPAMLLAAVLIASSMTQTGAAMADSPRPPPAIDGADVARRIHAYINEERTRHGLTALAWDDRLARIAAQHSRDMARREYLAHDSPEGKDFSDRYRRAGYSCGIRIGNVVHAGAENIALGRLYNSMRITSGIADYDWSSAQQVARKVVDGWMDSRGHRRNILTPYWRHEGIGVEIHPDNKVYVTQNFC